MGHSSIKVTFDVYGHLFSDAERTSAQQKMYRRDCWEPKRNASATPDA